MISRCDNQVVIIDTGMSSAYGGILSSLEIWLEYTIRKGGDIEIKESVYALYPGRKEHLETSTFIAA